MVKYTDKVLDELLDDIYARVRKLEAKMNVIIIGLKSISDLLKRERDI